MAKKPMKTVVYKIIWCIRFPLGFQALPTRTNQTELDLEKTSAGDRQSGGPSPSIVRLIAPSSAPQ